MNNRIRHEGKCFSCKHCKQNKQFNFFCLKDKGATRIDMPHIESCCDYELEQ